MYANTIQTKGSHIMRYEQA